jgi:hypothetical protein
MIKSAQLSKDEWSKLTGILPQKHFPSSLLVEDIFNTTFKWRRYNDALMRIPFKKRKDDYNLLMKSIWFINITITEKKQYRILGCSILSPA